MCYSTNGEGTNDHSIFRVSPTHVLNEGFIIFFLKTHLIYCNHVVALEPSRGLIKWLLFRSSNKKGFLYTNHKGAATVCVSMQVRSIHGVLFLNP